MNTPLTFNNIVNTLLDRFPEFKQSKQYQACDQEVTYLVFAAFSDFLITHINNIENPETDQLIIRAFKFFDEMVQSEDKEVGNLAVTGIFEDIAQDRKSLVFAKKILSERSLNDLQQVLNYTGLKDV